MEGAPSLREAVARFEEALLLQNAPQHTRHTYRGMLAPLRDDEGALASLDAARCRAILAERLRTRSESTARTTFWALRAFLVYCVEQHWLRSSPLEGVKPPKVRVQRRQPILTGEQMRRIACVATSPDDRLALLLFCEGLRASELLAIRWTDVRPDRILIMGKGSRPRAVTLSPGVSALLEVRPQTGGRLFCCSYRALYARVRRWGRQAGVPWLHPHLFRHAAATLWYRETADMDTMRLVFGWAPSSAMPSRYAREALEDVAVTKAREVGLARRLFGE